MPYTIEYSARADRGLSRLDQQLQLQIRQKLREMADQGRDWPHRALTGPLRGQFRLRVGDYRARYTMDHANRHITVQSVNHRSRAYK